MKIGTYNDLPSKISYRNEAMSLHICTLIADEVGIRNALSGNLMFYVHFERLKDDIVVDKLLELLKQPAGYIEFLMSVRAGMPQVKKLMKAKHKNKLEMSLISAYKRSINLFRQELKEQLVFSLKDFELLELVPFVTNGIWNLDWAKRTLEMDLEDLYIPELTQTITEGNYTLFFDAVVEELFSFSLFDIPAKDDVEFIKLPLWHFPLFDGFTYQQMKYSRDDLRSVLEAFKASFREFSVALYKLPFGAGNFEELKLLSEQLILPHKERIQESIDNSLYLSQLRNRTEAGKGMKFCLGITSVENLVDYYLRSEIIKPYVGTQVKQRIGREMDLKGSCIFVYCTF